MESGSKGLPLKHSAGLILKDSFLVWNSDPVIKSLCLGGQRYSGMFSLDLQDVFYSVTHDKLFLAVRLCIGKNGETCFRNTRGVSVKLFIKLPDVVTEFYH